MHIEVFGHTDIGRKREKNEDNFVCLSLTQDKKSPQFLVAVADGMGGHTGGEIASAIAIEEIRNSITARIKKDQTDSISIPQILKEAYKHANDRIFRKASENEDLVGMGSTLVAALISKSKATIANVGDSRAYLIRQKRIEQITQDHNWKNEQLSKGNIEEQDIINSPYKDLITRSLGLNREIEIDIFDLSLQEEDFLFLCSDGLYSLLSDTEILKILKKKKDLKKTCLKLVELANKRGGHDNITVIVAHVMDTKASSSPPHTSDTVKLSFPN